MPTPSDPVPVVTADHPAGPVPVDAEAKSRPGEPVKRLIADLVAHEVEPPKFGRRIDPLRSEGEMPETKLRQAGVRVARREFPRVTHGFFGADPVIAEARQAQAHAGQQLRVAFGR